MIPRHYTGHQKYYSHIEPAPHFGTGVWEGLQGNRWRIERLPGSVLWTATKGLEKFTALNLDQVNAEIKRRREAEHDAKTAF